MGRLTTHVLDTANGCPAANVRVELFRIELSQLGENKTLLADSTTSTDGRLDNPLLEGERFNQGRYELVCGVSWLNLKNAICH